MLAVRAGVENGRSITPPWESRLDDIPDPRPQACVTYAGRFLLWWGLSLFLFKLGSRRQLDFELARSGPQVLDNLNRLAGTQQTTLPVNKTLAGPRRGVPGPDRQSATGRAAHAPAAQLAPPEGL